MANSIRIKRGNEAQRTGVTPADGEPLWASDTKELYVGDGATAGGNKIGTTDLSIGTRTSTTVDVNSSSGDDATVPSATIALAGLQSAADKTKLDGIVQGSGNGFDADTLDTLHATSFVRKDLTSTIAQDIRLLFAANSTWGGKLSIGGDGHNATSDQGSIATTNGNLHLDPHTTGSIYLNFFSGTAGVFFGSGAGAVVANMSAAGNLTLNGTVDGRDVASDGTKLDYISITQAVDLDQIETDTNTNNGKETNVTTNLGYTASPTNGIVTSSDGTNATLPLADGTNAGLLKPADFTKLSNTTNNTDFDIAIQSAIASDLIKGWNRAITQGTNAVPTEIVYSKSTDRVKLVITWGAEGGELNNEIQIVASISSNSGTNYSTDSTLTIAYDSSGDVTTHTWS